MNKMSKNSNAPSNNAALKLEIRQNDSKKALKAILQEQLEVSHTLIKCTPLSRSFLFPPSHLFMYLSFIDCTSSFSNFASRIVLRFSLAILAPLSFLIGFFFFLGCLLATTLLDPDFLRLPHCLRFSHGLWCSRRLSFSHCLCSSHRP
jgi:hypothetical protein